MHFLDVIEGAWIVFTFLMAFFWVPAQLFSRRQSSDALTWIAGNGARMVLCVMVAVLLLSQLKALNATTVSLLFAGSVVASWLGRNAGSASRLWKKLQTTTIGTLRLVETWSFGVHLLPRARQPLPARPIARSRMTRWLAVVEGKEILLAGFVSCS